MNNFEIDGIFFSEKAINTINTFLVIKPLILLRTESKLQIPKWCVLY